MFTDISVFTFLYERNITREAIKACILWQRACNSKIRCANVFFFFLTLTSRASSTLLSCYTQSPCTHEITQLKKKITYNRWIFTGIFLNQFYWNSWYKQNMRYNNFDHVSLLRYKSLPLHWAYCTRISISIYFHYQYFCWWFSWWVILS